MNAYDFDKCIYSGDSTLDFYFYCLKKHPRLLRFLFIQGWGLALYILGVIGKTAYKQRFFSFLRGLSDVQEDVAGFWESHRNRIAGWYPARRQGDDLVVSASPEFLLNPICEYLEIRPPVASRVDQKTGRFSGENCYGEEKVRRVLDQFGAAEFDEFYSDSLSDQPMAALAKKSYLVVQGALIPWEEYRASVWVKTKRYLLSREFIRFLIIGCVNTLNGVVFAYLFSLILPPQIAFICGYLGSLAISYVLNSSFTFRRRLSFGKMIKFFVSYIPNFLIQNIVVFIFCTLLGLPAVICYILAAAIGIPVTFLLLKLFTFQNAKIFPQNHVHKEEESAPEKPDEGR